MPRRDEQADGRLRVAFVVGTFPDLVETSVSEQAARLLDRGVDVRILAFRRGLEGPSSRTFYDYDLASRVRYLEYPARRVARLLHALPTAVRLARRRPRALLGALDVVRHRRLALSLRLLYWVEAVAGSEFDVVHCHFGDVAHDFVPVREIAGLEAPLVTSFYGSDASRVFRTHEPGYYDGLKRSCAAYFVTSQDMRGRLVRHGFPAERVHVLPEGVDVERLPFRLRTLADGEELRLAAIGRFVEKKGFSDLLRALAIVKARSRRPVRCTLVGAGPLEEELRALRAALGLEDVVRFAPFVPVERLLDLLDDVHALVQPSKTAADGDMD